MAKSPNLLIIDARFYEDIADELISGATAVIENAGATFDHVSVPGVLEIPAALAMAVEANYEGKREYDAYVLLGCVIRGETSHYDIVAVKSARAIMDLSVEECLAVGNGILTVENRDQALVRARLTDRNKGASAAEAALAMIKLRKKLNT